MTGTHETSFTVAVDELRADAQRFDDAAATLRSVADVVAMAPAAIVDDWGWWAGIQPAAQRSMDAVGEHCGTGAHQLSMTAVTLAAVRSAYIAEEANNTHAATGLA